MRTNDRWEKVISQRIAELYLTPRLIDLLRDVERPDYLKEDTIVESEYIYGDVETGKTVTAAFLFVQAARICYLNGKPFDGLFINCPELFDELMKCFDKKEPISDYLDLCKNTDYLILDDLFGIRKPSDFVLQTLYSIINYRYEHNKVTIITCNYDLDTAAKLIEDDRITSRIERMCAISEKTDWRTKE